MLLKSRELILWKIQQLQGSHLTPFFPSQQKMDCKDYSTPKLNSTLFLVQRDKKEKYMQSPDFYFCAGV